MNSVDDIFEALGGMMAVSRSLGIKPSAASMMKNRQSINVRYWNRLRAALVDQGVVLSNDRLVDIHTRGKRS